MARGRRLKKVGGDFGSLEKKCYFIKINNWEVNIAPSKLEVDESNNPCGLELTMVTFYNSNEKITPNTNWEFRSRNGGLIFFRIYIH